MRMIIFGLKMYSHRYVHRVWFYSFRCGNFCVQNYFKSLTYLFFSVSLGLEATAVGRGLMEIKEVNYYLSVI